MIMDDNDGQMIFGDLVGLKLPEIRLTGEEKPRKNLTCPDRGRTRARCVTSAHATTCSTTVDYSDVIEFEVECLIQKILQAACSTVQIHKIIFDHYVTFSFCYN